LEFRRVLFRSWVEGAEVDRFGKLFLRRQHFCRGEDRGGNFDVERTNWMRARQGRKGGKFEVGQVWEGHFGRLVSGCFGGGEGRICCTECCFGSAADGSGEDCGEGWEGNDERGCLSERMMRWNGDGVEEVLRCGRLFWWRM